MKLTLTGKPLSTNNVYKHRCAGTFTRVYITDSGRKLREDYQWQLKEQWKDDPLEGEIALNIIIFFGDKRKHDWDNFHKLSMDACNGIVWQDDEQITEAHVFKDYDKDDPRIEIYVV